MLTEHDYLAILQEELIPALGCTEPISLAFGAATARSYLQELPMMVKIACSRNIIKNVKGVVVPNTKGLRGIEAAVAIGLVGGDASQGLEVLALISSEHIEEAKRYLDQAKIQVEALSGSEKLHYILEAVSENHQVLVEVKYHHTHIVKLVKDGKTLFFEEHASENEMRTHDIRNLLTVKEIVQFCEAVDVGLLKPIIEPQITLNSAICAEGLQHQWGSMVGRHLLGSSSSDLVTRAKAAAAAGSDARMSGCEMPVVINSGSGNQGITVSIPVIEFAREHAIPHEQLLRALAISNLVAIRQKVKIGRLSAYCGVVSAAIGSGAAITWLSQGTIVQIEETISNTLATISGMVCDGAKPSCAAKISVAIEAAFLGHTMAMEDLGFIPGDGLVGDTVEQTIDSIGYLASEGMEYTDRVIVSLMVDKKGEKACSSSKQSKKNLDN